jgi:valyl-tRNA synthetase
MGWPNVQSEDSDYHRYYPGSVLETGYDILFFWVARMVTLGMELTGKLPFNTVYLHGLVRDGEGQKMSKTKGNVIDPLDTIEKYGCDALRFSLVTGSTPGQDVPLSLERVEANRWVDMFSFLYYNIVNYFLIICRNFVNKLWNVGKFVSNAVANSEGPSTAASSPSLPLPERYIISKCHQLIADVTNAIENYDFGEAGKRLYDFLWEEFADWYVEISKTRLRSTNLETRNMAAGVLHHVWDSSLRLLHPYMPFITEVLWHHVNPSEDGSLMVAQWPSAQGAVDGEAIELFDKVKEMVRMIRNTRAEYGVDSGKKIEVIIRGSERMLKALEGESPSIALLARSSEDIKFLNKDNRLDGEGSSSVIHLVVDRELEVFLPMSSLINREKEIIRLTKQAEKIQRDISTLHNRLENPNFRTKAPLELVKEVEGKVQDLQIQLQTVQNSLDGLSNSG